MVVAQAAPAVQRGARDAGMVVASNDGTLLASLWRDARYLQELGRTAQAEGTSVATVGLAQRLEREGGRLQEALAGHVGGQTANPVAELDRLAGERPDPRGAHIQELRRTPPRQFDRAFLAEVTTALDEILLAHDSGPPWDPGLARIARDTSRALHELRDDAQALRNRQPR